MIGITIQWAKESTDTGFIIFPEDQAQEFMRLLFTLLAPPAGPILASLIRTRLWWFTLVKLTISEQDYSNMAVQVLIWVEAAMEKKDVDAFKTFLQEAIRLCTDGFLRKTTQMLREKKLSFSIPMIMHGIKVVMVHAAMMISLRNLHPNYTTLTILPINHLPFLQKQVGIKINASKLLSQDNFLGQLLKNRSQPRLLLKHGGFNEKDTITCGVPLGDGSICRRPPIEGRKRCAEHKGNKNEGTSTRLNTSFLMFCMSYEDVA